MPWTWRCYSDLYYEQHYLISHILSTNALPSEGISHTPNPDIIANTTLLSSTCPDQAWGCGLWGGFSQFCWHFDWLQSRLTWPVSSDHSMVYVQVAATRYWLSDSYSSTGHVCGVMWMWWMVTSMVLSFHIDSVNQYGNWLDWLLSEAYQLCDCLQQARVHHMFGIQPSHWPRGPVDLKSYWPPGKSTGPHFPPTDVYICDT